MKKQDVNKVINIVGSEWAHEAVELRKRLAILIEANERLREENARLREENERLREETEEKPEEKPEENK